MCVSHCARALCACAGESFQRLRACVCLCSFSLFIPLFPPEWRLGFRLVFVLFRSCSIPLSLSGVCACVFCLCSLQSLSSLSLCCSCGGGNGCLGVGEGGGCDCGEGLCVCACVRVCVRAAVLLCACRKEGRGGFRACESAMRV